MVRQHQEFSTGTMTAQEGAICPEYPNREQTKSTDLLAIATLSRRTVTWGSLWAHRKNARRGQRNPVYNWMRKHGDMNVRAIVLETADTPEELPALEMKWIAKVRAQGGADMNMTDGGEGTFGYSPTPEARARQSARMTGVPRPANWSDESRQAIREFAQNRMRDPEWMAAHSLKVKKKWAENPQMVDAVREKKSPLTPQDVDAVRSLYADTDATHAEIAELVGVSPGTIGQIVRGDRWAEPGFSPFPRAPQKRHEITEEKRLAIIATRARGTGHSKAKLTEEDVAEIRRRLWGGANIDSLVDPFGVSRSTIAHISADHTWTHVAWPIGPRVRPIQKRPLGEVNHASVLTEDAVREIRRRHDAGESIPAIMPHFPGVARPTIYSAATRATWKHVSEEAVA